MACEIGNDDRGGGGKISLLALALVSKLLVSKLLVPKLLVPKLLVPKLLVPKLRLGNALPPSSRLASRTERGMSCHPRSGASKTGVPKPELGNEEHEEHLEHEEFGHECSRSSGARPELGNQEFLGMTMLPVNIVWVLDLQRVARFAIRRVPPFPMWPVVAAFEFGGLRARWSG